MDGAVITGVVGIIATAVVGGLGLYFTYRARTQPYQQTLYARQIDLLAEVLAAVEDVHCIAVVFASSHDEQQINREAKRLPETSDRLFALLPRVAVFLPGDFYEQLHSFLQNSATFSQSCLSSPHRLDEAKSALTQMASIRMKLMIRAREIAGTAGLTQQTSRLISTTPEFRVSDDELLRHQQEAVDEQAKNLDKAGRYVAPAR